MKNVDKRMNFLTKNNFNVAPMSASPQMSLNKIQPIVSCIFYCQKKKRGICSSNEKIIDIWSIIRKTSFPLPIGKLCTNVEVKYINSIVLPKIVTETISNVPPL